MNRIKNIFQKYWSVFIIVALWFIFSSPYFIKGLIPFPSTYMVSNFSPWSASYGMAVKNNAMPDIITQIYPWKMLAIDTWKKGEIPLWNPYSFSGSVHAGNYQSAVFSPFNFLFFIFPFIDAWSIYILLQPLLAGIFMFLFLREIGCRREASIIGTTGYMFSGFLVTWMAYGTLGYAILFLPLILWSITKYFRTQSLYAYGIGILGILCSFLSGHFQISVYVWMTALCYLIFSMCQTKKLKEGIMLFFMLVIGLCITAPQLFLTYDAFQASVRSANTELKEVIPWQYIITFFSPDFFGNPVTRNDWFGHYAEWAGYIGVIPLLLSLYSFFFSQSKKKIFFVGLGIVSLLLAYSSPLSIALFSLKIPVLSTSAASRIICITSFSFCVLGALGFEQVLIDWKKEEWKKKIVFFIGIFVFLCLLWGVVFLIKPFPVEQLVIARRNIILPTIFACIGLVSLAGGFFKRSYSMQIASALLILVCCFDSYRYASKWMPFDPKEFVYPHSKVIAFLQKELGGERIFGNIGNEVGSYFHIPLIEGYDAMYQGRYGEFINAVSNSIVSEPARSVVQFDKSARFALPAFQLLGVKYIVHRLSDGRNVWTFPYWQYSEGEFVSIYRDEHYEVFVYREAFPRLFLASSYIVKKDRQEIIDALFQKNFDRRNTLILEDKPVIEPAIGEGVIKDIHSTENSVTMNVTSSAPVLLFRSEAYDPGWNAVIDGKRVPLYRADYDFQAVAVPEGEHKVVFYYWPKSLTRGVYVVFLGIGLLTGIVVHRKKRSK